MDSFLELCALRERTIQWVPTKGQYLLDDSFDGVAVYSLGSAAVPVCDQSDARHHITLEGERRLT